MKLNKLSLLLLILVILLNSCSKDNPPSNNSGSTFKWKRFKVVSTKSCSAGSNENSIDFYINFWNVISPGNEEPSDFIPKPNTWYRTKNNIAYKTGSDVSAYDGAIEASFNCLPTGYSSACP